MALLSLLLLTAGAAGAAAPHDLQTSCDAAQALTEAGHPQLALDLIEKVRGPLDLQVKTLNAACEAERLDAVAALGATQLKDQKAVDASLPAGWDAFVKTWVVPFQSVALAWLGLIAALLILARLFVFIPRMPLAVFPWKQHSVRLGRFFLVGGLLLILTAPAGLIYTLSNMPGGTATAWTSAAILIGIGLLGAFSFSLWMSSRLRVSIEARDSKGEVSEAATNRMVALLNELGSTPPQGLEIPRGTDVTALNDSLASTGSGNKVLTALRAIIQIIFGAIPWRVSITESPNDHLAVVITRNGWAAGAATITRDNTDLFPAQPGASRSDDLHLDKMAAAFILTTIATRHQGFEGLCGATDWRSVGLQSIATTDFNYAEDRCRILLAKATDFDPKNLPAEVALQNRMYRRSTNLRELEPYAKWLWNKQSELAQKTPNGKLARPEAANLLLRLRFTYLCITLNLASTPEGCSIGAEARDVARELMESLKAPSRNSASLALQMRPRAAVLCLTFDCPVNADKDFGAWLSEGLVSTAPYPAYSAACHYAREARRLEGSARAQATEKAKDRLRYSFVDPELKAWASKDPELRRLADLDPEFAAFLDSDASQEERTSLSIIVVGASGSG